MKVGRAGSLLVIILEDLKGWRKEAKREKDPQGRMWDLLVRLVQVKLRDRTVPEEIAWAKMFLIPKGKGGYIVIGLVEVLWEVC